MDQEKTFATLADNIRKINKTAGNVAKSEQDLV